MKKETLNKTDLIDLIVEDESVGLKKADVQNVVNRFLDLIVEHVQNENINISGFGSFTCVERAGRNGVNPRTQEKIVILPKKTIKFGISKKLKDSLNS